MNPLLRNHLRFRFTFTSTFTPQDLPMFRKQFARVAMILVVVPVTFQLTSYVMITLSC